MVEPMMTPIQMRVFGDTIVILKLKNQNGK
jgi:hypothetical protein